MKIIWAITKRELNAFFITPVGWLCLFGFSLLNGIIFSWVVRAYSDPAVIRSGQIADINQQLLPDYFGTLSIILLLLSPALSMRSFSEDLKQNSFALLLSSPISSAEIVLGKFLGIAAFSSILLTTTLPCSILLLRYSEPDIAILSLNYITNFLLILSCSALGMTISAGTKNQLVSISLSFISIMILWFLMGIAPLTPSPYSELLSYMSLLTHINTMSKGLIHTQDLFYFGSFIAFFLYTCTLRIERYRWQ